MAQTTRLIIAVGHLWDSEARRQAVALEVTTAKTRAMSSHNLEHVLAYALERRRTNAQLALHIAEVSNALAPDLALTSLRRTDVGEPAQSFELDGRTRNISAILTTLRRLSVTGNLELHREDADGAISFRLDMNPQHSGASK